MPAGGDYTRTEFSCACDGVIITVTCPVKEVKSMASYRHSCRSCVMGLVMQYSLVMMRLLCQDSTGVCKSSQNVLTIVSSSREMSLPQDHDMFELSRPLCSTPGSELHNHRGAIKVMSHCLSRLQCSCCTGNVVPWQRCVYIHVQKQCVDTPRSTTIIIITFMIKILSHYHSMDALLSCFTSSIC